MPSYQLTMGNTTTKLILGVVNLHIFPLQGSLLKNPITLGRLLGAPGLSIESSVSLMAIDNQAPSFLMVTYCTCQVKST